MNQNLLARSLAFALLGLAIAPAAQAGPADTVYMPVVEKGEPVGIVSSRSALDPEMEEFTAETQRRLSLR